MTNEIEHSGVGDLGDINSDASFLLARLDEFRSDIDDIDDAREFEGHIVPAMARLRTALARPAQEPVAWRYKRTEWGEEFWHYFTREPRTKEEGEAWEPLYAAPQPVINPTHSQVAGTPGLLTETAPSDHMQTLTRPIIGIENRTGHEVFDIMVNRFRRPASAANKQWPADAKFSFGDRVRKHSGSWWEGVIVGFYSTHQTLIGYNVQMDLVDDGPVQIYPETALEAAASEGSTE